MRHGHSISRARRSTSRGGMRCAVLPYAGCAVSLFDQNTSAADQLSSHQRSFAAASNLSNCARSSGLHRSTRARAMRSSISATNRACGSSVLASGISSRTAAIHPLACAMVSNMPRTADAKQSPAIVSRSPRLLASFSSPGRLDDGIRQPFSVDIDLEKRVRADHPLRLSADCQRGAARAVQPVCQSSIRRSGGVDPAGAA